MSIMKFVKICMLTTLLASAIAVAQTPYDEGQKALREQNWSGAAKYFEDAIDVDRKNADASMYWRAHALYKAGRDKEAERQINSLKRNHPDSRWIKEAQLLVIEHEGSETELVSSGNDSKLDADLRMFALVQLMERDPQRALPLVMEMIENTDSEKVSSDMLFMLGMSDDPEAQKQIARIARDSSNHRLQVDAVQMLGIASKQSSMELLAGLYRDTDSDEVKEAVIQAHMISDLSDPLVDILKSEKNPDLRTQIIHALGVMGATDELDRIYPTLTEHKVKVAALEAFSIAGDSVRLERILATETDPELRKTAINGIAMEDDSDAVKVLEAIYDNAATTAEKKAVLEALVMVDDAEELVSKIVRAETNEDLRRTGIQMLGVLEATGKINELYGAVDEVEFRKALLESMMIADDAEGLMEVLKTETDPEMRTTAIQALAVSGGKAAAQYLTSLYPDGTDNEKHALIQSMLIMDHAKGLIDLLETETDADMTREILQMLSLMDSKEANEYLFEMLENKG